MKIGYHISISGGLVKTAQSIKQQKMSAVQIFAGSPRTYFPSKFTQNDFEAFQNLNIPKFVHINYLVNPASDKPVLPKAIAENLQFCDQIGADGLIIHMGSNKDKEGGMELTRHNFLRAYEKTGSKTKILIETTAEGGDRLKFDLILKFLEENKDLNISMCLDTCHMYAAGYTSSDIINIIEEHHDKIGLIHLNNPSPNVELGKHKDQHDVSLFDPNGKFSKIEIENIINISMLYDNPLILETGDMVNDLIAINEKYLNL